MTDAPLGENSANTQSSAASEGKKFQFFDLFGLGKLMDKLPLTKLTARMTYSVVFSVILLGVTAFMYFRKSEPADFPTAWDVRGIIFLVVIVFFVGIWDKLIPSKET
ncbi:hypothetical protein ACTNDP_22145 [Paenibacillus barengoltzii]|uniref:hypothetical protein n=1 Tax=Paenibacillus TaxID=44249 RepID=UPI0028FD0D35|nr:MULTISPECIES: hypothetical protein [Paenibacillus]MDU0331956.1 hypothetical protein [Paenibacillus sp. 3LSP]MEC2345953.1 hypothetical protein [Paenibacillus barengoltzii]